jgi:hypothetical protein
MNKSIDFLKKIYYNRLKCRWKRLKKNRRDIMAFCANCGTKLEEGIKFCSGCGMRIASAGVGIKQEEAVNFIQAPGAALSQSGNTSMAHTAGADEMYCFSCGSPIKKAAGICPNCGVNQSARISAENISLNKNLAVFALASIILFSIGPVLNLFLSGYNPIISMVYNITQVAGFVLGIIAFAKLQKSIGTVTSYSVIILLAVNSIIRMYYLINIIKNM